jgi:murein DD-endopeptidase MepM/ murein hydrolase activator NlpD
MMVKGVAAAAAVVMLAVLAGSARADSWTVLPESAGTSVVSSADVPNASGSLVLPPDWTARASSERALSLEQLAALWRGAGAAYGIPWQVLASINKIESNFGRNMGPSSAGAVGWMQFMPDTWLRWGMDADGDGIADPWNPSDAVYAAARYLAAAGGRLDIPRAIFAYNHADWYVRQVLELARFYGGVGSGEVAFNLDRLQLALEDAQKSVAAVNEKLVATLQKKRRLARRESSLLARAQASRLLSDALALRKRAGQVGVRVDAAAARARRLASTLAAARKDLQAARARTRGAAFTFGGRTLFGTASYSGDYVFPVGGGPAVVSVGRTHHDYPAADIAAPMGSPLYALASGLVRRAWATSEGRCGIGFTMDTEDGQTWTYCHLSYLEPTVGAGTLLAAGQPVGLVGSTGHSTGPHLHLQLNPTNAYPQDQDWFQSFAGLAFSWQDEVPSTRTLAMSLFRPPVFMVEETAPVFAVVPSSSVEFVVSSSGEVDEPVLFTRTGG